MDFHVFHDSARFGLFPHVFGQFFVPAEREKRGISGGILMIWDSWAMGASEPGQPFDVSTEEPKCRRESLGEFKEPPLTGSRMLPIILTAEGSPQPTNQVGEGPVADG
jgi:hypothetical protein